MIHFLKVGDNLINLEQVSRINLNDRANGSKELSAPSSVTIRFADSLEINLLRLTGDEAEAARSYFAKAMSSAVINVLDAMPPAKSADVSTCPRCGECKGSDHHWMEEATYATYDENDDPLDAEPIGDRVCKHCPAIGNECEECGGHGTIDGENESGQDVEGLCEKCDGQGIILVLPATTP